ncbi:hypothetical protein CTAYLR_003220 [Chrysophaeum taylorii]|uniref:cellulase n=1 Tax=Chrysophaeum taylorii TaxID=2483200 RepID=A0AAD7UB67_9STRA|nr:hypothetical protein CTAYLR_003220 [Chrysophaeum taylorii]
MPLSVVAIVFFIARARAQIGCCFFSPEVVVGDQWCASCEVWAETGNFCAESAENCGGCGHTWCVDGVATADGSDDDVMKGDDDDVLATLAPVTPSPAPTIVATPGCCFVPEEKDRCSRCEIWAEAGNYCAESPENCATCEHIWCDADGTTILDGSADEIVPGQWYNATYTTGYWDCCKPSCSWPSKGNVDYPVRMCEAETGLTLSNPNTESVCDDGTAASCSDNIPFTIHENLTMGFAAAAVGGISGLNGDENCGQCFELKWTDDIHTDSQGNTWGGAHPDIVGKSHVIQVTNIGYDVTGDHSFDLQIPGAGQGIFDTGCVIQFPGYSKGDFDCAFCHPVFRSYLSTENNEVVTTSGDVNYGGCDTIDGCARLPEELQPGCEWRYSPLYRWLADGGQSNNPFVLFRRVQCPEDLVAITGTTPLDDANYPLHTYFNSTPAPSRAPSRKVFIESAPSSAPSSDKVSIEPAPPSRAPSSDKVSIEPAPPSRAPSSSGVSIEPAPTGGRNCSDSKGWHKTGDTAKDCDWVASFVPTRCAVKGEDGESETFAYTSCPETCGTCSQTACEGDSASWYLGDTPSRDCTWVHAAAGPRCHKKAADGTYGFEACSWACGACSYDGCEDDEKWTKNGEPSKDCSWVAEAKGNRCIVIGDDGNYAYQSCRAACHACFVATQGSVTDDNCTNDDTWHKAGDTAKDCDWATSRVSSFVPKRCLVKGEDDRWGFEGCSVACGTC